MNPEVDALKHFFAAINRNDMQAMTRDFDPEIVRIEIVHHVGACLFLST